MDDETKAGIIIALGALIGGVAGNKLASRHKIVGTLVGAGIGAGLAALIANMILENAQSVRYLSGPERTRFLASLVDQAVVDGG